LVKVCRFLKKQLRVCKSACFFGFKYKNHEFLGGIALYERNGRSHHLKPLTPSMPFMSKSAWNAYFGMYKKVSLLKRKRKLVMQYIFLNQLSCKDVSYFLGIAINYNPHRDIAASTPVLYAKHEKILYNIAKDTE
jgi:hypothetical protein